MIGKPGRIAAQPIPSLKMNEVVPAALADRRVRGVELLPVQAGGVPQPVNDGLDDPPIGQPSA